MNRFRQFMYGRYGLDTLSQYLVYLALILTLVGTITRFNILINLSYIPLVYSLYRMLSKNISKRTQENNKFMAVKSAYQHKFHQFKDKINGSKTYRYFNCPSCKQKIRIPKGKGKICITCPKCRTEFIKRT
ncbi:MAG: hypothetical protein K0R92_2619 [Lachnospiraceae bacterium]|nr:hypothetical protein [Lachnospiraceae bacterium]